MRRILLLLSVLIAPAILYFTGSWVLMRVFILGMVSIFAVVYSARLNILGIVLFILITLSTVFNYMSVGIFSLANAVKVLTLVILLNLKLSLPLGPLLTDKRGSYYSIFLVLLVVSIFALTGKEQRYVGFSLSATTFSIYILGLFLFFVPRLFDWKYYALSVLTLVIIWMTGTRSTLYIFLMLQVFSLAFKDIRVISVRFITLGLALLPFLFVFYAENYDLLLLERSDDMSLFSRLHYYSNQYELLKAADLTNLLVGHGAGQSSYVSVTKLIGINTNKLSQHNDFFVLLYDFGLIVFLMIMGSILRLAKSPRSYMMIIVYLSGFLHNMIYDYFLLFLITMSYVERKEAAVI